MPTVEARINLIQKYSSLIIRQVSRLRRFWSFCEQGKTGMRRGMSNAGV